MSERTLLDKVWELHRVRELPDGRTQLYIGCHLIHEVTSPQAFAMLREAGLEPLFPQDCFATVDHIIPTDSITRPFADPLAETMMCAIEENTANTGITFFDRKTGRQGVIHVTHPELGIVWPGMTLACGDSHTSTHGAFGVIAFGVGTSNVKDILASGCHAILKPKVRRINITGTLQMGVYVKDVILKLISDLTVAGGKGFAYEFVGSVVDKLTMEERMTLCNMVTEGGAIGWVNPDETTLAYLKDRPYAPPEAHWNSMCAFWRSITSDENSVVDDEYTLDVTDLAPMSTWGLSLNHSGPIDQPIPDPCIFGNEEAIKDAANAMRHMRFKSGDTIEGHPIQVAFIGSCTEGRIENLREAARIVQGRKVVKSVSALVVPGSQTVSEQAKAEGLDKIFIEAGFDWRELPGCSMCLGMNPDRNVGTNHVASSSNRPFLGRQGSKEGGTLLMSAAMVAEAAINGCVTDVRPTIKALNKGGAA